jgi:hypothetical protein
MRRSLIALLLLAPGAASGESLLARYEVHALGSTVLELEARFDVTAQAYAVEAAFRTRGLAALIATARHVSRAHGSWVEDRPVPAAFVSEGIWRGRTRRIRLDWQGSQPRVLELLPPSEEEAREPVPQALRQGTMDILSAFVGLGRHTARNASCDLVAPIFDGRRRSDFTARSEGRERILPWRGAWHGEALRCGYEGRLVAGFRRDQDRAEAGEPQRGTAWIAAPYAGAPAIPVRVDIPTRWFGTVTAVLLGAEPIQRGAELRR